jgi:site-specific recombinase XerD
MLVVHQFRQSFGIRFIAHLPRTHLALGAELRTVRDNLRHGSIATTSIYLHSDEIERAQQLRQACAAW